jgi:hypothetical protein
MPEQLPNPNPIAALNDAFRKAGPAPDWYITQGARALPDHEGLIQAVQNFDDFNPGLDAYGEHDMGEIHWHSNKVWFKFDYYDQELRYWCDPLSEECRRVLTILLASEY